MRPTALALALGAASSAPTLPTRFHANVTMTMPYYGLVEPIEVWYDLAAGLQRLDYYGGLARLSVKEYLAADAPGAAA